MDRKWEGYKPIMHEEKNQQNQKNQNDPGNSSGENNYFHRILNDSHFRFLTISALGGEWNFIYAFYHLVLAVVYRSFWFLTMGLYYLTICGMRMSALTLKTDTGDRSADRKTLKRNAFLTFALSFIFTGVVCLTIVEKQNQVYSLIVAISMATYTFYCVISAIRNLIHLKKERTVKKIMLRNCSMVYALGSLFGLERMMLGTFGNAADPFTQMMETRSGAGIFIVIVLFGINQLLLSSRIEQ